MPYVPILSEVAYDFRPPDSGCVVYGADTPWGRLEIEVTVTDRGIYSLEVFHTPDRDQRAPFRPALGEAYHWTTLHPEQAALFAATVATRFLEMRAEGTSSMDAAQLQRLLAELARR
ncbi:hypothetical protein [Sphingomonas daechungensis]|uniref:hypothetical protein n=1 Tax=Sphingomonas daechungensis TaxID=1176646 RepID=UPI003784B792